MYNMFQALRALEMDYGYIFMYSTTSYPPNHWKRALASVKTIYIRYLSRGYCYKSAVDAISSNFARREIPTR